MVKGPLPLILLTPHAKLSGPKREPQTECPRSARQALRPDRVQRATTVEARRIGMIGCTLTAGMGARLRGFAGIVAALVLVGAPAVAPGQVFLATDPHPPFSIGPLFAAATVTPDLRSVAVRLSFSLTFSPRPRVEDIHQDLYLLWPAELAEPTAPGPAEAGLRRFVEERGFEVVTDGRLRLRARDRAKLGTTLEGDPIDTVASFVTFYKRGTNAAQTGLGTFIKIPWTPLLADPVTLLSLTMRFKDLITPKPATWFEELFWGRRYILTLGAGTAGSVAFYSLYLEQREHVVRLARDFSLLAATFDDAEHVRIEEISPPGATRRPSRVRAGAETVILPLGGVEGSVPQILKVQFSYFSGRIAWRPVLISLLFLVLGNVMGAFMFTKEVAGFFGRYLHLGRAHGHAGQRGVVLPADVVERIVPERTTPAEVVALCGTPDEERQRFASPGQRTLIYHGSRIVAHRRHHLGWVATVSYREEEQHEVEITIESDRVRDVQTRIRRTRVR